MVTIVFTKRFVSGVLNGCTITGNKLRLDSSLVRDWEVRRIGLHNELLIPGTQFIILDYSIQR